MGRVSDLTLETAAAVARRYLGSDRVEARWLSAPRDGRGVARCAGGGRDVAVKLYADASGPQVGVAVQRLERALALSGRPGIAPGRVLAADVLEGALVLALAPGTPARRPSDAGELEAAGRALAVLHALPPDAQLPELDLATRLSTGLVAAARAIARDRPAHRAAIERSLSLLSERARRWEASCPARSFTATIIQTSSVSTRAT